jgi:hypothetical protein
MRTRGDLLRFAIAFALRGASKLIRGLKQTLTEDERYRVADDVVNQLEEGGLATFRRIARHDRQRSLNARAFKNAVGIDEV